ncbi:conserved hypothetical protein [Histoplasma capsulatum var. duboisii H88]|uniref:Uncharacterized protein n=2 Tax=Ajellomyces capsulatus TaxID=5037 RepID=F0UAZ6_AJEC8|nr:conserved hypothetical protein [Histoplasma capsulatum H143]EGC42959.1 conserved hypothetical protein [Histoplasma capsulatum var. duboisii H88]
MAPNTDITTQALVVALKSSYIAKTTTEIMNIINLSAHQINHIYVKALEHCFNFDRSTKQTSSIQEQVLVKKIL